MRPALLLGLGAALLAGCAAPGLTRVRNEMARTMPEAQIGRGRSFGFGPVTLALARSFAGREAAEEGLDLGALRRVRFATYPVRGTFDAAQAPTPAALRRLVERDGWAVLVASREADGATWVLYRARGADVTDLLTASLDAEELTLTHVSGDLDRALRGVLDEHAGDLLPLEAGETP
jgi:hypothetical protein